jgi:UDP-glucose 4-epimerase
MVDGTFNVLEAASAAKVRRFVLASSAVVYGDPIRLPYDEDHPVGGTRVYGAAKVANEQMARAFAHATGLPTTILRYFNVYGPRQDIRSPYVEVMVKWLDLIDQGKPLVLFGDGSASVDFVYVEDVARANLLACDTKTIDDIANVCSGIETRMSELAAILLDITGSHVGVEYRPQPAGALPARRYGDPRRAKELLGFTAKTELRDGVKKLIAWRREALASKPAGTA